MSKLNPIATADNNAEYGDYAVVKVVAVIGGGNDWAAYFAPDTWTDERIMRGGEKIPESAARFMFPVFRNLLYRD